MERFSGAFLKICYALIPVMGVAWILSVPQRLGVPVVAQEAVTAILGIAVAAAFLQHPYGKRAGWFEVLLAIAGIASWMWASFNYENWIVGMADRTPEKWVPGAIGLLLMMEALRKTSGLSITCLVWTLIAYAFFGHHLPGVFEAEAQAATKVILYSYADSNGVPGLVLTVICSIVLAFILFGRLLEMSGATEFFTNLSMGWMGHRRGGPAKVAVVASSAFGMISGSTVGNIMSTGVVTIPLMKRAGFKPHHAGAIEAVASNGGQIAPPVMGTTAFLIAEFLQISYGEVVLAAVIPAFFYYLVLFLQVDSLAVRFGLRGIPKSELPSSRKAFAVGWVFLVPIAVLLYYLFWLGYNPDIAAMYGLLALFVLMVIRRRRLPSGEEWRQFAFRSGEGMLPIILIGAGAGVVIGVLSSTGLAFQLALILSQVGSQAGLFAMLLLTAIIAIILGMGMPTAAVYIVLQIVLAPAMAKMGVVPLAAHLFLFYFGLLSMLTPPVAVASYVAAGLAGSSMWMTGWVGMQLAVAAYLLPFLWVYNPALIGIGSAAAIIYVVVTAGVASWLLAYAAQYLGQKGGASVLWCLAYFALALFVGGSTVWFGPESPLALATAALGAAAGYFARLQEQALARRMRVATDIA